MRSARALHCAARATRASTRQQSSAACVALLPTLPFHNIQAKPSSLTLPPLLRSDQPTRPFSTSPCLHKKGAKAAREEKQPSSFGPPDDPFDFTLLTAEIASTIERLKTELSKLRAGGRFNPEILENLRVQPDKNSAESVKLGDLAQIIPKGRTVQILVGEKEVRVHPVNNTNI